MPAKLILKATSLAMMHVLGPIGVFCAVLAFRFPDLAGSAMFYLGTATALHFVNERYLR